MKSKRLFFRIFSFLLALIYAVSVFTGCAQKVGSYTINGRIVATVNGFDITFDEYKYFYYNHMMDLKNEGVTDFSDPENIQKIKDRVDSSLSFSRKATPVFRPSSGSISGSFSAKAAKSFTSCCRLAISSV